jgi:hypothetical protein
MKAATQSKLNRWSASNYSGPDYAEYFVFLQQNRDSYALTRSNFRSGLKALGESETVLVERHSHWAVGWVEFIFIHQDDTERLAIAEEILERMEDYPVVDEMDYSDEEFNEACETWDFLSVRDRVELLQKHNLGIFAARRSELPEGLPYFDDLVRH